MCVCLVWFELMYLMIAGLFRRWWLQYKGRTNATRGYGMRVSWQQYFEQRRRATTRSGSVIVVNKLFTCAPAKGDSQEYQAAVANEPTI